MVLCDLSKHITYLHVTQIGVALSNANSQAMIKLFYEQRHLRSAGLNKD